LEVAVKGKSASTFEMRDYTNRLSDVKVCLCSLYSLPCSLLSFLLSTLFPALPCSLISHPPPLCLSALYCPPNILITLSQLGYIDEIQKALQGIKLDVEIHGIE
jgi:hypothetical protein